MTTRTDAHQWDMDAAWDWTGPCDPDVLEIRTVIGRREDDDPWLSRCWHGEDAWEKAANSDRARRG